MQVCLAVSVGFAYSQVLWKALKHGEGITIATLDNAFAAQTSVISFLNQEMLWKIRAGSLIALIGW